MSGFDSTGGQLISGPALADLKLSFGEVSFFCQSDLKDKAKTDHSFNSPPTFEVGGLSSEIVTAVTLDSRLAGPGVVFVALKGDNRDGHDFVEKALTNGALGVVVRKDYKGSDEHDNRLIRVPDTLTALGNLARSVRMKVKVKVAAVTGSVGKTTVKEMLKKILLEVWPEESLLVSYGNFNNQLGLPLTLLSLGPETKTAVVELGANHFGEIEELSLIARPDVGLVTTAGQAHLEYFGDLDGVARAKGELYRNLPQGATAIVNAHDELMVKEAHSFGGQKIYFGFSPGLLIKFGLPEERYAFANLAVTNCEVHGLTGQTISFSGQLLNQVQLKVSLKLPGIHNAINALAAATVALSLGADREAVKAGLEKTESIPGRFKVIRGKNDLYLVDDSYNANPTSVEAALKFMAGLKPVGGCGAILGEMLELGDKSLESHLHIGRMAGKANLSWLALVGSEAKYMIKGALEGGLNQDQVALFDSPIEAAHWVGRKATRNSVTLVKGSRSVGLERAVKELLEPVIEGGSEDYAI